MSALTPHIAVLRALGDAFAARKDQRLNAEIWDIFDGLAKAMADAADQLEVEDAALKPPRSDLDRPITYDPKGKR